jgi:hypothetical protein
MLLGGCASDTEQAHQRFFVAVKADPLFSWHPDWAITDKYAERSGDQPFNEETGAILTRLLAASPVPTTAVDIAAQAAISAGWLPDIPQYYRKNLSYKGKTSGARLLIAVSDDHTSLTLEFVSWTPLP